MSPGRTQLIPTAVVTHGGCARVCFHFENTTERLLVTFRGCHHWPWPEMTRATLPWWLSELTDGIRDRWKVIQTSRRTAAGLPPGPVAGLNFHFLTASIALSVRPYGNGLSTSISLARPCSATCCAGWQLARGASSRQVYCSICRRITNST